MTITVEDISSGAIVRISGEVDLSVSPEIKEKILEQIDISDPKFVFCIAGGSNSDGGFKIFSQRPDGSDQMTLNANNAKSGW